jgi:hypothetical protein
MKEVENKTAEAIQRLAEAVEYQTNVFDTRCDFNGYTVADSMGIIADSMFRIAEAMEKNK